MKKKYIEPTIKVTEIESENLLTCSNEVKMFRDQYDNEYLYAADDDEVL